MYSTCVHTDSQNMPKYAYFGYEKMSKSGPIFGHLKNDQILSNFCDPQKVSKVLLEWSLEISFRPKLNKIKKMRSKPHNSPPSVDLSGPQKGGS